MCLFYQIQEKKRRVLPVGCEGTITGVSTINLLVHSRYGPVHWMLRHKELDSRARLGQSLVHTAENKPGPTNQRTRIHQQL